jgi:hypothetical protein
VERDHTNESLIARHRQASEDGDGDHDIYALSAILDYPESASAARHRPNPAGRIPGRTASHGPPNLRAR